jgi:hypothetical protein
MRVSRALAIAAAVLAPAGLVVVQAGPSAAHPVANCGAITMFPHCPPDDDSQARPVTRPTFPYMAPMATESVNEAAMTQRVVQLPTDHASASDHVSAMDIAPAPAESPTLLNGVLPVASDRTVASGADQNGGLPMAPIAAAGTVLGGLGTLVWFRRKRHSN